MTEFGEAVRLRSWTDIPRPRPRPWTSAWHVTQSSWSAPENRVGIFICLGSEPKDTATWEADLRDRLRMLHWHSSDDIESLLRLAQDALAHCPKELAEALEGQIAQTRASPKEASKRVAAVVAKQEAEPRPATKPKRAKRKGS